VSPATTAHPNSSDAVLGLGGSLCDGGFGARSCQVAMSKITQIHSLGQYLPSGETLRGGRGCRGERWGIPALHSTRGQGKSWGWPRVSRQPPGDFPCVTYLGGFLFNAARTNGRQGRARRTQTGQGTSHRRALLGRSALTGIFAGPPRESPLAASGAHPSSWWVPPRGHPITSLAQDPKNPTFLRNTELQQRWMPSWGSGVPRALLR